MKQRMRAFFSAHSWRYSFTARRFLACWLAAFSVLWTFTEFIGYFFTLHNQPVKPNVWAVLAAGIAAAAWMSRPRLTRTVRIGDKEILLQLDINDMFDVKGGSLIIPANCYFKHDHIDEDSIIVQFRNRFFAGPYEFDQALADALRHEPFQEAVLNGSRVKKYPIGTVAMLPLPGQGGRIAYLLASADLNEHGRGIADIGHLRTALESLWKQIGLRGNTKPLVIPVMGSGRQRLVNNRLELIGYIVRSFLSGIEERKFTDRLTIVIHPGTYVKYKYNLDDMESYLSCAGKFGL